MGRSLGFGGQARIFVYEGRVVYVDSDWTCADPTHKKTKIMMNIFFQFGLPLICATLAFIYWRRASIGLEDHLKQVSFGFLALAIFELLSLASLFRESRMVWLSKLKQKYLMFPPMTYFQCCTYNVNYLQLSVFQFYYKYCHITS